MPNQLIAPQLAAGNTAPLTVVAGSPISFGLYTQDGSPIPFGVVVPITRQSASGAWQPTGIYMTSREPNQVITGAGVYRGEKPITTIPIGVEND